MVEVQRIRIFFLLCKYMYGLVDVDKPVQCSLFSYSSKHAAAPLSPCLLHLDYFV